MKILAVPFLLVAGACDPVHYAYFAVSPHPNPAPDSSLAVAFNLVERVAARHGLAPRQPTDPEQGWHSCLGLKSVNICGKKIDNEAQFMLSEWDGLGGFRAATDSLRREILDSLRADFGATAVRECQWRSSRTDVSRDGCAVLAARPGSLDPAR